MNSFIDSEENKNTQESEFDISLYILKILTTKLAVIWSWGFDVPQVIHNGLVFDVTGFLFTGKVQVIYNEGTDLFDISFFDPRGQLYKKMESVFVDQVVDVIDEQVERVANYSEQVDKFYGLNNSTADNHGKEDNI